MFVPLEHPPGDAQADFGEAMAVIEGVRAQGALLVWWTCRSPMPAS